MSAINFRHQNQIIEEIDYNRLDTHGIFYEYGRYYKPDVLHIKFKTLQERFNSFLEYIQSKWFYFKIGAISLTAIIIAILVALTVRSIMICSRSCCKCCKNCKEKKTNKQHSGRNNKSINLIKAFLPEREDLKEINLVNIRRSNSVDSIIDPATIKLLNRLRKENEKIIFQS